MMASNAPNEGAGPEWPPSDASAPVTGTPLRGRLARALPFYYGWVVLAATALTSLSTRPLTAVSTLSVFVVPMTDHFGWSRGLFSGAVSLGGLGVVAISPLVGRWIDRYGAGPVLAVTSAVAGACAIGLASISHVWAFYLLYVPGRIGFAGPLELSTTTAVSNWFLRRRPLALALFGVSHGAGLAAMPLVVQVIIGGWDWRMAWASLGVYTILVGVLPPLLLIGRRPEDMGLEADPAPEGAAQPSKSASGAREAAKSHSSAGEAPSAALAETHFTVREALHTRAFWVLAAYSAAGFMAQSGVALHQVPHYISQGVPPSSAAFLASTFAVFIIPAGLIWSPLARRVPVRVLLAFAGLSVALGALATTLSGTLGWGLVAAGALGTGVGGMLFLLRLTWADYYGRRHLGAIRGLTLPVQVGGQALGPVLSGFIFDATGSYRAAFFLFAAATLLVSLTVLAGAPPKKRPAGNS
jgi:MFS family permease